MRTGEWGRDSVRRPYRLKSERERQISYINALMRNQEKWYRQSYLQNRKRDTDIENKHMDTKSERGVGGIGRLELIHTYVHIYMYIYIFSIDTMYKIDK